MDAIDTLVKALQKLQDEVMSHLAAADLIKDAPQALEYKKTLFKVRTKLDDTLDAAKLQKKKVKGWLESVTSDQ